MHYKKQQKTTTKNPHVLMFFSKGRQLTVSDFFLCVCVFWYASLCGQSEEMKDVFKSGSLKIVYNDTELHKNTKFSLTSGDPCIRFSVKLATKFKTLKC